MSDRATDQTPKTQTSVQTPTQTKSRQRVADHGEVFTAEREVNAMLNLVKPQSQQIATTFLEPACGTGNFLAQILSRKLATALAKAQIGKNKKSQYAYEFNAIWAISSIYGIELLVDNCAECRERLLALFVAHYQDNFKKTNQEIIAIAKFLLDKNIVNGNALDLKVVETGEPIIFSEWKFSGENIIRRDFYYANSDNNAPLEKQLTGSFIAQEIHNYPPIYYLDIMQGVPYAP